MTIQPGNEPFIIDAVKEGSLDVGIILDPPFRDPELHCRILREEELVIIASPAHKFASVNEVQIGDLEKESFILTEEGCTYRAMLLRTLKGNQIPYSLSYEFGNLEAIKQCVMYGLGIALLPRIVVAEDIQKGRVIAVPLVHPDFKFYTQLIYSKKNGSPKRLPAF